MQAVTANSAKDRRQKNGSCVVHFGLQMCSSWLYASVSSGLRRLQAQVLSAVKQSSPRNTLFFQELVPNSRDQGGKLPKGDKGMYDAYSTASHGHKSVDRVGAISFCAICSCAPRKQGVEHVKKANRSDMFSTDLDSKTYNLQGLNCVSVYVGV